MSRTAFLSVLAVLGATPLAAQSSQFGVRGLGLPLRPNSVRAAGTGGAFGLFDWESAHNPASFAGLGRVNVAFQTVQAWTRADNPHGTASLRDNRYPGVFVSGPIGGTRLSLAVSATGFTDRNFAVASRDSILLRDALVEVVDTITSLGGISDLRAAVGWRPSPGLQGGIGLHILTGSNRITSHRVFSDSAYLGATERNLLSYLGFGISAGVVLRPHERLTLAGAVRAGSRLRVERDTARLGTTRLPLSVSGAARVQVGPRLSLAGAAQFRNWSVADADLVALGGVGSTNTTEWSAGLEFLPNPTLPFRRPLRLGVYHSGLPFPLQRGVSLSETGISAGTSTDLSGGRIRLDLAVSRVWRKGGAGFSETATLLNLGVALAPPGLR